MKDLKEIRLLLKDLDCANCANKIEKKVNNLTNVKEANLNFSTSTLIVELYDLSNKEEVIKDIKEIVKKLEPKVKVVEKTNRTNIKIENKNIKEVSCCKDNECCMDSTENHHHNHDFKAEPENKLSLIKENLTLILGALVFAIAFIFKENTVLTVTLFVLSYILIGGNVIKTAFTNILRGDVFDENFLMTVATLGAFFVGQLPEAVAVMLFYEIGELFQSYAVDRSRKSITSLMNIRAEYANLLKENKDIKVLPETVKVGDIIIIKPGERVPLDGIIIEGKSYVDTSALTGESVPRQIRKEDEILAGSINTTSVLKVKVTKEFGQSTVSRILELVENASNKKAPTEKFITKFSRKYTPIVVFCALILAIVPPLVIADATFKQWIYRACVFLVVSCPCALVISIPLGLFAGIGGASKKGVLIKGGNYLEALKSVDTVVFDKTGTLTKGTFKVTNINSVNIDKNDLLEIAALAEAQSNHPVAKSIVKAYGKELNKSKIKSYEELAGYGVCAYIDYNEVLIGNAKLMDKFNIKFEKENSIGTIVYIAINKQYKGDIIISDEIKEGSKKTIAELKKFEVKKIVMLTGDSKTVAEDVAKSVGIDEVYSDLLPLDKVEIMEKIMEEKSSKGKTIFVGDGINDSPVLARADIGVAMGGIGSDAAIEAADVVLMKDEPEALVDAIKTARKTSKILWQNIIFALGIKIFVLILGAFGVATMWEAVFSDVGVTLIAVLNSSRCLR